MILIYFMQQMQYKYILAALAMLSYRNETKPYDECI